MSKQNQNQTTAENMRLVRLPEAAKMLGICRSQAYELVRRGELGKVQMCSEWRIPMKDIVDYCERNYSREKATKEARKEQSK